MVCPSVRGLSPVHGDNPRACTRGLSPVYVDRALTRGLSPVYVDYHGITI